MSEANGAPRTCSIVKPDGYAVELTSSHRAAVAGGARRATIIGFFLGGRGIGAAILPRQAPSFFARSSVVRATTSTRTSSAPPHRPSGPRIGD